MKKAEVAIITPDERKRLGQLEALRNGERAKESGRARPNVLSQQRLSNTAFRAHEAGTEGRT